MIKVFDFIDSDLYTFQNYFNFSKFFDDEKFCYVFNKDIPSSLEGDFYSVLDEITKHGNFVMETKWGDLIEYDDIQMIISNIDGNIHVVFHSKDSLKFVGIIANVLGLKYE